MTKAIIVYYITYFFCWLMLYIALIRFSRWLNKCGTKKNKEVISHEKSPTECGIYRTIEQIEIDEMDPIDFQLMSTRNKIEDMQRKNSIEMGRWGSRKTL